MSKHYSPKIIAIETNQKKTTLTDIVDLEKRDKKTKKDQTKEKSSFATTKVAHCNQAHDSSAKVQDQDNSFLTSALFSLRSTSDWFADSGSTQHTIDQKKHHY